MQFDSNVLSDAANEIVFIIPNSFFRSVVHRLCTENETHIDSGKLLKISSFKPRFLLSGIIRNFSYIFIIIF